MPRDALSFVVKLVKHFANAHKIILFFYFTYYYTFMLLLKIYQNCNKFDGRVYSIALALEIFRIVNAFSRRR